VTKIQPLLTWRGAVCESDLRPATRHVALTLSLYMSERGDSAYPGARRLAHDTGLTERSVRDHLAGLVKGGWLQLVEKGGNKGDKRHANVYAARVPDPPLPLDPGSTFTREARSPVKEDALTPEGNDTAPLKDVQPISSVELSKNSLSRDARVDAAFGLLIERDVASGKPDNPRAYEWTCRRNRENDGTLGLLNEQVGEHPDWTAEQVVDAIEGFAPLERVRSDCFCSVCNKTGDHFTDQHEQAS